MLSVNGIYDGKSVIITDKFSEDKSFKVIVTFIEELPEIDSDVRIVASQTSGIVFWNNEKVDIYQESLSQTKIS
jgi:hypothetical protein